MKTFGIVLLAVILLVAADVAYRAGFVAMIYFLARALTPLVLIFGAYFLGKWLWRLMSP